MVETLGAAVALTADVFVRAARSGNAELLAWLHERAGPPPGPVRACSEEQLEWLAEHGCPMWVGGME
ncbi:hypothetical protein TSOC_012599 [Tetrabaena socialis]|uniref:Ankyrin repeat domain-containing protein n=1 Tax=Tetrabaena socialis TaxID=47790 RepID=A0A2J7ZMK9_9CHLO|nr:hypothetical protein TSOC_012599 [Tetrabaena socialis]|eukprot:PNH01505.1 hypothetical protein TSOC_012599 [Tetrabaena socialis]